MKRTWGGAALLGVVLAAARGGKTEARTCVDCPDANVDGQPSAGGRSGSSSKAGTSAGQPSRAGATGTTTGGPTTTAGTTAVPPMGGMPSAAAGPVAAGAPGGGSDFGGSNPAGGSTNPPDNAASGGTTAAPSGFDGLGCPGQIGAAVRGGCGSFAMGRVDTFATRLSLLVEASRAMSEADGDATRWEVVTEGIAGFLEAAPGEGVTTELSVGLFPGQSDSDDECESPAFREPVLSGSLDTSSQIMEDLDQVELFGGANPGLALAQGLEDAIALQEESSIFYNYLVLITSGSEACGELSSQDVLETVQRANEAGITVHVISLQPGFPPDELSQATGEVPFAIGGSNASKRIQDALLHVINGGGARTSLNALWSTGSRTTSCAGFPVDHEPWVR